MPKEHHDGEQERPVRHEIHRRLCHARTLMDAHGRGCGSHGSQLVHLNGGLVVHSADKEPISAGNHAGEVAASEGSGDSQLLHVLRRLELERELELWDHEPPHRDLVRRRVLPDKPPASRRPCRRGR